MKLTINLVISLLLLLILVMLMLMISFKYNSESKVKSSPFECGFMNLSNSGTITFSLPFFMVSLMFLMFDVEILLLCLFPMISLSMPHSSLFFWLLTIMIFFITIYEWMKGAILWI